MNHIEEKSIEQKDFLELLKKNNKPAVNVFINMYYEKLYKYFLLQGFNSNQSLELIQETVCKFLSQLKSRNEIDIANTSSYLFKVAKNCAIDEFRKHKKDKKTMQNYLYSLNAFYAENNDDKLKILFNLIQKLDDVERDIIILHTVLGKTFVEVSNILDISISSSKRTFYKAFEKLRALYFTKVSE